MSAICLTEPRTSIVVAVLLMLTLSPACTKTTTSIVSHKAKPEALANCTKDLVVTPSVISILPDPAPVNLKLAIILK